jgi:hypothetical protein
MNSHGYKVNPVVENTNDQGRKVKTRKKALWSDRRNKNVARNPILTEDAIKIYQILDPILNESRKLNHVNKRQAKVLNDLSEVIFAQGIEDYMHQKRSFKISEHGQELLQLIEQFVSEQPRLKGSRVVCNLQDQIKSELTSPKLR